MTDVTSSTITPLDGPSFLRPLTPTKVKKHDLYKQHKKYILIVNKLILILLINNIDVVNKCYF